MTVVGARNPADWLMDVLSGVVPNEKLADFRPAMLFDIWNTKKNDINRPQPLGLGGWLMDGEKKMMPSIPLLWRGERAAYSEGMPGLFKICTVCFETFWSPIWAVASRSSSDHIHLSRLRHLAGPKCDDA